MPLDRLTIAYHEAGHAVVAIALGLPVAYATCLEDSESFGHVVTGADEVTAAGVNEALEHRAADIDRLADLPVGLPAYSLFLTAGGAAERRLTGQDTATGDWRDRICVEALLSQSLGAGIGPASRPVCRLEDIIQKAADRAVAKRWGWITRTAEALLARGTLSGTEITALRKERAK